MKTKRIAVMAGAVLAISVGGDVAAQDTASEQRGSRMTSNPEMIMSLRDRLELTDDQLAALEQLRAEGVERRTSARSQMDEMRSRLRAGEIEGEEMRAFLEELRAAQPNAGDRRARVEGILTEDQLQSLEEMRRQRPGVRGDRGGIRGPRGGVRGGRGAARRGRDAMRDRRGAIREWRGEMRVRRSAMRARRTEMRGTRRWVR